MALATIRLDNATIFDRHEPSLAECVVHLPQGTARSGDTLCLDSGEPCEIVPIGALWPDGSYRTVLVRGWVTIAAHTRREIGISKGTPAKTPAIPASAINAIVSQFPQATLDVTNTPNPSPIVTEFRTPDGELKIVIELEVAPTGRYLYWKYSACWSNPNNPASNWTMPYPLELVVPNGMLLSCQWGAQKAVSASGTAIQGWTITHGTKLVLLPANTVWGDGQMHMWRGALLIEQSTDSFAALHGPILACATAETIQASKAWSPFGMAPTSPAWWPTPQSATDWAIRSIRARDLNPRADPWHEQRYGLRLVPGSTGDQMDFGLFNCMGVVMTGEPLAVDLYLQDALQDSCRPTHFYEASGDIVRHANHPWLIMWDQRPHFNAGVCPDRLGKAPISSPFEWMRSPQNAFVDRDLAEDEFEWLMNQTGPINTPDFHGWWGRDNQHWSANLLCSIYYITGDSQVRRLIEHECETWLAQQNLPIPPLRPGWPTTGPDASRAVGRTLLAGSWLYLCSSRNDVRQRLKDRVDLSIRPAWSGQALTPPSARPYMLMQTDGRQAPIPVGSQAWFPWQEGIAVAGLEACYRVTGHQPARDLAKELARTLCDYGWQWRAGHTDAQVANCVVWANGADVNRDDPLVFQPADGTDFALWVQAATILSDAVYHNSSWAVPLRIITAQRYAAPPNDGGPGRYAQWTVMDTAPVG